MRAFVFVTVLALAVMAASAACGDGPKYTGSYFRVVNVKSTTRNLNVPDLQYQCPKSMRPNVVTDFDQEVLLAIYNQQLNANKLPRGYNCQTIPGSVQVSDTSSCITNCGGNGQNQGFNPNNNNCNNNQGFNPDGGNNQGFDPNGSQQGFNQWPKTALVNGVVSFSCQTQGWSPSSQLSIAYQARVQYSLSPDCQDACNNNQGFQPSGAIVC